MMGKQRQDRYIRFQGNRMMLELTLGRQLTKEESILVYNNSSKKTEIELWGIASKLPLTELVIKEFTKQ
jgi:hypothetical protein